MTQSAIVHANLTQNYAKFELDDGQSIRVDSEGRWCSYRQARDFYQRTLDNEAILDGEVIDATQRKTVDQLIGNMLSVIDQNTDSYFTANSQPSNSAAPQRLLQQAIIQHTNGDSLADLFAQTYAEPVPILPPDRYRDIVVLPATGCPNSRCSFCAFYQDKPFRSFSRQTFQQHLRRVKNLFGLSIESRNGIFLGSANALALPQKKILPMLTDVADAIGHRKRGIASFFDPEHAPKRSISDWQALAEMGLSQLVIGLETGLPSLRKSLGKSGQLDRLSESIAAIKQAKIRIGLTILIGIGDQSKAAEQRQATARFIDTLELERHDKVYLSPYTASNWNNPDDHYRLFKQDIKQYSAAKLMHYNMAKFRYFC